MSTATHSTPVKDVAFGDLKRELDEHPDASNQRVKAAKAARTKTGDVGAAFLIAPAFDERAANAWQAATRNDGETSWAFGAIDKATSYEGFVRMGPRRGFHLVLVAEARDGFEVALHVTTNCRAGGVWRFGPDRARHARGGDGRAHQGRACPER
jgi:hypothetical protein